MILVFNNQKNISMLLMYPERCQIEIHSNIFPIQYVINYTLKSD